MSLITIFLIAFAFLGITLFLASGSKDDHDNDQVIVFKQDRRSVDVQKMDWRDAKTQFLKEEAERAPAAKWGWAVFLMLVTAFMITYITSAP